MHLNLLFTQVQLILELQQQFTQLQTKLLTHLVQHTSAGGKALVNTGVTTSTVTSHTDFSDLSVANGTAWTSASFTTRGCLIYNTTAVSGFTTNRAVCSIDFGGDKTVSNGTFSIEFPTNSSSAAIIRLTS